MSDFAGAFEYLLGDEGKKFTNNPRDAGGPTKYGVTKKAYEAYLRRPVDIAEMENLTTEDASEFYIDCYWRVLGCHKIESQAIAIALFDTGVLYGVKTAAFMAQKVLNICTVPLRADGLIGDKSIAVLNLIKADDFLKAFHGVILERIAAVIKLNPEDEEFRKGWTARAHRLLTLTTTSPLNGGDAQKLKWRLLS